MFEVNGHVALFLFFFFSTIFYPCKQSSADRCVGLYDVVKQVCAIKSDLNKQAYCLVISRQCICLDMHHALAGRVKASQGLLTGV